MKKTENLAQILNKVLNSKALLKDLMSGMEVFDFTTIQSRLAIILCYYVATRDTQTNYTFDEIERKYYLSEYSFREGATYQHIMEYGVLTHACNGHKRERIEKYGFDYTSKMPDDENAYLQTMRAKLEKLENILGKSRYAERTKNNARIPDGTQTVFMSSPGTKTIYYATKQSPERFFLGVAYQSPVNEEPMVVGETKHSYIIRVLINKLKRKSIDDRSVTPEDYVESAKLVQDLTAYYCSKQPAIILFSLGNMQSARVSYEDFNENDCESLEEYIKWNMRVINGNGFFTSQKEDFKETNNMENIVTVSTDIPQEAIIGIIDVMDEFDLRQLFAKNRGLKVGDLINSKAEVVGEPNIEQLMATITPDKTREQLEEIQRRYLKIREDLQRKKEELKTKLQAVFARPFIKRNGAQGGNTLSDVFDRLEKEGLLPELLIQDDIIKRDEQQYLSSVHGATHTRRVNFFATVLMMMENITGRDKEIVFEIAKNHDIGRYRDGEDQMHGYCSVRKVEENSGRLEGFTKEEQDLIKFVISQHSIGKQENIGVLASLPDELRERYSRIFWMFTDADKLDRVRLEPTGTWTGVGLEPSRLSLESSRALECLAYETNAKLFEVLDLYKQQRTLDEETRPELFEEFEEKMRQAYEVASNGVQQQFLDDIVEQSKKQIGYMGIVNSVSRTISKATQSLRGIFHIGETPEK